MYFYNHQYVYYATLFVVGLTCAKNMMIYIYLVEMSPARHQMLMAVIALTTDVFVPLVYMSLYFYFGGKEWKVGFYPVLILPFISFMLSFFIPESPRYLYARRFTSKLKKTMKRIASINGTEMPHVYSLKYDMPTLDKTEKEKVSYK